MMTMTMPAPELMALVGRIMAEMGEQHPPPYEPLRDDGSRYARLCSSAQVLS